MNLEIIIFDLDGTLLDTLEDLADSSNLALKKAGLQALPIEEFKQHIGSGARNLIASAIASSKTSISGSRIRPEEIEDSFVDRILTEYRKIYAADWAKKTKPYPGVKEMLRLLKIKGIKLAVLSNKPDDFTTLMVEHYFDKTTFDRVYGLKDPWPPKPDPALALNICRQINADPQKTALIGDSGSDMETAVNAGLLPWGVTWGFRSKEELLNGGASKLFYSAVEIAEFVK